DRAEAIRAAPSAVVYVPVIGRARGVPVAVATEERYEFRLRAEDGEQAITDRTRAILLGFPNNPTGAVLTDEDRVGIARLAERHDLLVYADEIYDRLVYGGEQRSIVSLPAMRDGTIVLPGCWTGHA